ncbi:uncharacterized protein MELLADRAFT_87340 [Melampsora larici-populina 98AG31]|uniref:OTU domain-containing protein n=1 Tax=Melampsora larici-populina (strain 98AG31 / pathotype 3-4-7) TaxID=747676 RepID=F4RMW9_MELLP|nr:uncharacterized protein MELLADRAFT_87340 [Melampsora larici-populina 98AG31]EGG06311.1 hypothetical protein MELLADRAFT_87340 [Melampsora larici-populina 98AG31]
MQTMLKEHAAANGYKIIIRSSEKKLSETISIRYKCQRSGLKPSNSSCSRKTDCPFAFTTSQVLAPNVPSHLQALVSNENTPPVGSWIIKIKNPTHNHEPIGSPPMSDSYIEPLTVIKQRSSVISHQLSQLSNTCRTAAIAEIEAVIVKYQSLGPSPIKSSALEAAKDLHIGSPIQLLTLQTTTDPILGCSNLVSANLTNPTTPVTTSPVEKSSTLPTAPRPRLSSTVAHPLDPAPVSTTHPDQPEVVRYNNVSDRSITPSLPAHTQSTEKDLPLALKKPRKRVKKPAQTYLPPQTQALTLVCTLEPAAVASPIPAHEPQDAEATLLISPTLDPLVDYESEPAADSDCLVNATAYTSHIALPSPELFPIIHTANEELVIYLHNTTENTKHPEQDSSIADHDEGDESIADHDEGDESFQLESLLPIAVGLSQKVENTPLSKTGHVSSMEMKKKRKIPLQDQGKANIRRSTRHNKTDTTSISGPCRSARTCVTKKVFSNPRADGHCGYRAIAISLGRSEDDWHLVREELIAELEAKAAFYENHFHARKRGDGGIVEHISVIRTQRNDVLDTPLLWLNSAQMLYLIATTYQRLFCVYGPGNQTFSALPLDVPVNDNPPIFLCYNQKGLHFLSLSLLLSPTLPIPKPWEEWYQLAQPQALGWANN